MRHHTRLHAGTQRGGFPSRFSAHILHLLTLAGMIGWKRFLDAGCVVQVLLVVMVGGMDVGCKPLCFPECCMSCWRRWSAVYTSDDAKPNRTVTRVYVCARARKRQLCVSPC